MKKLLTILLALLVVTGVVFAAEFEAANVSGQSTLTLTSNVKGDFEQGFTKALGQNMALENISAEVVLKDTDPQEVGHYYVYTNASVAFTVTFTVTPLQNSELASVKVPYTLGIATTATADINYGDRFTLNTNSIDLGLLAEGGAKTWKDEITASPATTVITSTAGGSGVMALDLTATFAGNDDLPEGDYTGTVYANIVTNG